MDHVARRLRLEVGLALASAALLVATLISREWIEAVFGVDPDHGDGSLEWVIVALTALAAIVFALLARADRRRLREAAEAPS